jgi:gamma-glutamylcyclotransferase (GGCT)/AIG2-like uncharacterized protein YtfP
MTVAAFAGTKRNVNIEVHDFVLYYSAMATKYVSLVKEMYQHNEALMAEFDKLHAHYEQNQQKWQSAFNAEGEKVMDVMRFFERQLCGKSERSGMGVYSSKLAEKYWAEIKKRYPMIDFIGAKIS